MRRSVAPPYEPKEVAAGISIPIPEFFGRLAKRPVVNKLWAPCRVPKKSGIGIEIPAVTKVRTMIVSKHRTRMPRTKKEDNVEQLLLITPFSPPLTLLRLFRLS